MGEAVVFTADGAVLARAAPAPAPRAEDLAVGPDPAALAALEVPGRPPAAAAAGAGPAALVAALAALALLLAAAGAEASVRSRSSV
jgi:hypothetical protein